MVMINVVDHSNYQTTPAIIKSIYRTVLSFFPSKDRIMAGPCIVSIKVLDVNHISPPPGSVQTTSIPLTFFDLPWVRVSRPVVVERLFFYDFPHHSSHFIQNLLPLLKHTLSLTLQHFFPYAASLMCPPQPRKPYLSYTDSVDSVPFTVVESSADFHHVVVDYTRDVTLFHPFVPRLAPARLTSDGTHVSPLLALQVTLFPGTGICIGATYNHAVADGSVFMKFINFWASLYMLGGESSSLDAKCIPYCNRDVIKDNYGMEHFILNSFRAISSSASSTDDNGSIPVDAKIKDKVRSTFFMSRDHIERLKNWVSKNRIDSEESHVSTFVVTCAFIWVCMEKMKNLFSDDSSSADAEMFCYFLLAFDCRHLVIPAGLGTYFGNCLMPGLVMVKKIDLMGQDAIVTAARAIGSKVTEMKAATMADAMKWWEQMIQMHRSGNRSVNVAGSPKLSVYDTDFGWGRPRKVEVTHIECDGAMSVAESRNEKGGIEVGVALSKNEMGELICIFEENLKLI